MGLLPLVQIVVVLSSPPMAAGAAPSMQGALDRAIKLFESFEDEEAGAAFAALLERSPPGEIAARAHLYLGLIAFNAFKPDLAKAEFRQALAANFAEELPQQVSPKARATFAQVRRDVMAELEGGASPKARHQAPQPAPAATTSVPDAAVSGTETTAPAPTHSHTAAYMLGSATLLLAAVAVYGGVEVLNYSSMVGAGTTSKPVYSLDQLQSAKGPASFWAVGWPVAAGLAAAGAVGTGLTW